MGGIFALNHEHLVKGLNLWMDAYIADPRAFEATFETVSRHLAEKDDGAEPTYGQVGAEFIYQLLDRSQSEAA